VGPTQPDRSWQARERTGFAAAAFVVDWNTQQVSCPGGKTSVRWQERKQGGKPLLAIDFARHDCQACAYRPPCTRSTEPGRRLTLAPEAQQRALQAARQREQHPAFREQSAPRAGMEGPHSQAIRRCGLRKCRYWGMAKTRLQHALTAAALNLVRVGCWLMDQPRAGTRTCASLRLVAAAS
jgi:hypothetical protein